MSRRTAVIAAASLAAACAPSADVDQLRRQVEGKAEQLQQEVAAQRDETRQAIEKKLLDMDRRIEKARAAARRAHATRADAERRLKELEREGQRLRKKVEEARVAGTQALGQIERSIDHVLGEIEAAFSSESTAPEGKR